MILRLDVPQPEILFHMLNAHTAIIHNILGEETVKIALEQLMTSNKKNNGDNNTGRNS